MKSKISFFNKTIFLKNLTLYWPIWGVYLLILLFVQPFMLWMSYNNGFRFEALTESNKLSYLSSVLTMPGYIILIAIMAVITGMAVFSYLYNSRTANMIHSLPVDRTQLFGTNVISGLTFLAAPQIVTFFISVFVCLGAGVTRVEYLAYWLLLCIGIDFVAFSVVAFCTFFTGQLITMPIYVVVVNCLSYLFYTIIDLMVSIFAYGVSGSAIPTEWVIWTSPFLRIFMDVNIVEVHNEQTRLLEALAVEGISSLLIYMVIAVLLYLVAYIIYQKRQIEQAGDLITVEWVKPIFRWGVGTSGAFLGSIFFYLLFMEAGNGFAVPIYLIWMLCIGIICYFVADMFVKKSFKVFNKKGLIHCGFFVVALLATFGALYGYAEYTENLLPNKDKIVNARIDSSYTIRFGGAEVEKILQIHEEILKNKNEFESEGYYPSGYSYVYLSYLMEDGKEIERGYRVPTTGNGIQIIKNIHKMEMEPEIFLQSNIGLNYKEVDSFIRASVGYFEPDFGEWNSFDIETVHCKQIYDAVIADAQAGVLQTHNLNGYYEVYDGEYDGKYYGQDVIIETEKYGDESATLTMQYYLSEEGSKEILERNKHVVERDRYGNGVWFYDDITGCEYRYEKSSPRLYGEFTIQFGMDCKNIIDALKEAGYEKEIDKMCGISKEEETEPKLDIELETEVETK